jgi:hypothetical protein
MNNIFPFAVKATDCGNSTMSPRCYDDFMLQKPQGMSWYAFDVIIQDKDRNCTFVIYDMKCNVYGGIGRKTFEFEGVLSEGYYFAMLKTRIKQVAIQQEAVEFKKMRDKRVQEIMAGLVQELA